MTKRAEKSAASRERLLQATFDCLYELGYSRTTTLEVCSRSGASRGALLHHFPTRARLLAETAGFVMFRGLKEYKDAVKSIPAGERSTDRLIDLLWKYASGKTSLVWIELVLAARTDPALRSEVDKVRLRFRQGLVEAYEDLVPALEGLPEGFRGSALEITTHLVNGLALYGHFREEGELQVIVDALKKLFKLLQNDTVRTLFSAPEAGSSPGTNRAGSETDLQAAAQAIKALGQALQQPEVRELVRALIANK